MSTCVVPQNQPIYQALLDKAATYPADKPYQARAYKKAAESILSYKEDIYRELALYGWLPKAIDWIGEKIEDYIGDFIKNTPVPPVTSQPASVTTTKCVIPGNQPIYQALLDKAASYPADKSYQAKAYKKAAESILSYDRNIYDAVTKSGYFAEPAFVGEKIAEFIYNFVQNPPVAPVTASVPAPVAATAPITPANWSVQAMDTARKFAAENAPKDVTTWPDDAAERAAFQERLAASKQVLTPEAPQTVRQIDNWWKVWGESQKPVVYTAENPRRSKRIADKPKVEYFTKEDEDDEIAEVIESVCAKRGWDYSDDLIDEFNTWVPAAADKYALEKYDYKTDKYVNRTKAEIAKEWAKYYSTSLQKQYKDQQISKGLVKYCQKHNIEYQPIMADKFATWMADPANKHLITYTYNSMGGCNCSSCNPTGTKREAKEYTYNRNPSYCINKWFSTLKKTIVW